MYRKSSGGLQTRDFNFDIKAVKEDGFFSGYGSVFDVVDSYNEIVAPGAFAKSLAERAEKGRKLPILWQHRAAEPLGVYTRVEEDKKGLYLEGRLLIEDIGRAREAHALMKAGAVTGQSIGYWVRADSWDEKTYIRTLKEIDLQETSIVTFPANDEARIEQVKGDIERIIKAGKLPTLPEFEDFLREAGFSKSQATVIAGRGLRELLSRSDSGAPHSEVVQLLTNFSI